MLYYILAILVIVVMELMVFLDCYDNNKVNVPHMALSGITMLYLSYVLIYFHNRAVPNGLGLMKTVFMFAVLGLLISICNRRIKFFLIAFLFNAILNGFIIALNRIHNVKINVINIIFSFFGILVGYVLYVIINEMSGKIREHCIIKARKYQSKFIKFEIEFCLISMGGLFVALSGVEAATGRKFLDTSKGVVEKHENDKYADIYYADRKKYDRYDKYAKLNPDMEISDVVWRVDANLDKEFYDEDYVKVADYESSAPLLINKFNRVSDKYKPKTLVTIEGNYLSTPATAQAYKDMLSDMKKEEMKVYVVSSYRDVNYQKKLHNNYLKNEPAEKVDSYSARPGYSEHHTGRALDISHIQNNLDAFEGSEEAEWVYNNCYKYGFIVRYKEAQTDVTGYIFEPWHITYVGKEIAETMKNEGIETLEEYVVKYVDYHN